jgi:CheY-like chemotaxis protein
MVTILVIDDEPIILNNLTLLLELENFNVIASIEGKDALNLLHDEPVHLILCDMLMVPMDGFEILRAIRQNPATAAIPFVFVTGMRYSMAEARAMGVSGYLVKPFTRAGLLEMVHHQLLGDAARQKH